jgi:hypothetical protein
MAWIPILAPLISIVLDQDSPDDMLNDFMAVGFNFKLPPELLGRYGPRKRAYGTEVQAWIDQLDWTNQWTLARALARHLLEKRPLLVHQRLEGVGWQFDGATFTPTEIGDVEAHAFFPAGAVHDAYVHIRSLFKDAKEELFIIDGFIDASIFEFLLSTNGPKKCRILTFARNLPRDFLTERKLFVQQHGFDIVLRTSSVFHDRQIIVDGQRAFVLGASIKDAGKKAFHIIPVETPSVSAEIIRYGEEVWRDATPALG